MPSQIHHNLTVFINALSLLSSYTVLPAVKLLIVLFVLTKAANASVALTEGEIEELAQSPGWLNLLHYRPTLLTGKVRSQADDVSFFYAPAGDTDAKAELQAFIHAVNHAQSLAEHPACRFPARYRWLAEQVAPASKPEEIFCPELEAWISELNAQHITLVYAASYLNNPSSMFGHTFLRVDPANLEDGSLLITNTISYAADVTAHDNEIMFAYRGIFGGYPGITVVEPYYQKLKIYNDIENRDLWEYRLDLTPEEVQMVLLHTWEIKDIRFDYFFFDENCAYRLFAILDVARPEIRLTEAIPTLRAIPADTVRILVAKDIVSDITYRPSKASILAHQLAGLSEPQKDAVLDFLEPDFSSVPELTPLAAAHALETAYELQQFRSVKRKLARQEHAPIAFAILQQRGGLAVQTSPRIPQTPSVRDDQGHDTLRLSLLAGQLDDNNYLSFEWRPAYHDLDDPLPGYRKGSHLQFFNTALRWYTDNQELQLEHFKFVEILSLSPRNRFVKPLSWQAGFGGRRSWIDSQRRPLVPYGNTMVGLTYELGPVFLTTALTGNAEVSSHLPSGGLAEAGAAILLSFQSETLRLSITAEQRADFINDNEDRAFAEARLSFSVTEGHALHLRAAYLAAEDDEAGDFALGWYSYF